MDGVHSETNLDVRHPKQPDIKDAVADEAR